MRFELRVVVVEASTVASFIERINRTIKEATVNRFEALEPHLPRNQPSKPQVDDRRMIFRIIHILEAGVR